ncbi:gustatory receptor for sugar taste 64f-like [Leptopilina heterotoma]|uniref:gustatory receptor for sugar taste 64f-like n=1 Tax=Leptopilina heterotoma TaxID=63436 RepID=UPI001CA7FF97|nr:gustatory receptor for sugar taste 64f-like [Leptopilina heterotoma]
MKSLSMRKKSGKGVKITPVDKKMVIKKVEIAVADSSSKDGNSRNKVYPFFNVSVEKKENDQFPEKSFIKHNLQLEKRIDFKRGNSVESPNPESFANAIGLVLLFSQFFGLLPISGIKSNLPEKFKFMRTSPRTIYTYIVIIGSLIMSLICLVHMVKTLNTSSFKVHGGISDATVGAVFYGNSLFGTILFLNLSPGWISLQQDWRAMEEFIDKGKGERPKLRCKFSLITASIFIPALIEHILSVVSNTPPEIWGNSTFDKFLQIYTIKSHPFLVKNVPYNFTLGLYTFVLSRIATFTWNFTDAFIMLVSTGLAERYKQLNKIISNNTSGTFTPDEWKQLREYYAILSTLVKKVDQKISSIIFLSFVNNLYFICLQLLNGLSLPDDGRIVSVIYFFGSFFFLIGRTVAVTLLAARIHDQSKIALPYLYNCPPSTFTGEAQRLQVQLTTDEVALTGLRFFSITRNFMLAVAGAIVTYEVVLLQFNMALQK